MKSVRKSNKKSEKDLPELISEDHESDDDNLSDGETNNEEFCHYNDTVNSNFQIEIFGFNFDFIQLPMVSDLGIGACVWDSSIIIAKYMELHSKLFTSTILDSKTVLELGAGCGLSGLTFLMKGAKVTFSDLPRVVEDITGPNVTKNYRRMLSCGTITNPIYEPDVWVLDWTNLSGCPSKTFDYLLLTDCVFSEAIVPHLIQTILMFSHSKTTIYCVYEARDECITNTFLREMKAVFKVKDIAHSDMHPDYRSKLVRFFQAKRKLGKH